MPQQNIEQKESSVYHRLPQQFCSRLDGSFYFFRIYYLDKINKHNFKYVGCTNWIYSIGTAYFSLSNLDYTIKVIKEL